MERIILPDMDKGTYFIYCTITGDNDIFGDNFYSPPKLQYKDEKQVFSFVVLFQLQLMIKNSSVVGYKATANIISCQIMIPNSSAML